MASLMGSDDSRNSLLRTARRRIQPEMLEGLAAEEAKGNLRDLARINRWFGAHRIVRRLLREIYPRQEAFSVLDVGAASGDLAVAIRAGFPGAAVVSMDRRLHHLDAAPAPRLAGDAWRLPFAGRSFDIVFCSLLLHHYADAEAVELLRRMAGVARRALIALDLERHPIPYWFLPLTRPLFGWDPVTVHDGPVSVAAGFHPSELERLARQAGLARALVRTHPPWFRLSLVTRCAAEP